MAGGRSRGSDRALRSMVCYHKEFSFGNQSEIKLLLLSSRWLVTYPLTGIKWQTGVVTSLKGKDTTKSPKLKVSSSSGSTAGLLFPFATLTLKILSLPLLLSSPKVTRTPTHLINSKEHLRSN